MLAVAALVLGYAATDPHELSPLLDPQPRSPKARHDFSKVQPFQMLQRAS